MVDAGSIGNPYLASKASVSNLGSNYGGAGQSPGHHHTAHKRINSSISRYGGSNNTQPKGARQYLNMSFDEENADITKKMEDFDRKMKKAQDRKLEKQKLLQ